MRTEWFDLFLITNTIVNIFSLIAGTVWILTRLPVRKILSKVFRKRTTTNWDEKLQHIHDDMNGNTFQINVIKGKIDVFEKKLDYFRSDLAYLINKENGKKKTNNNNKR